MQIIYVNTRGYIHKYHSTLLSIELLLQLQTTVTSVLRLYRSYFDNYLSELAFSSYFTIYSKMATTTRTLHLFEHIELLSQLKMSKSVRISISYNWFKVNRFILRRRLTFEFCRLMVECWCLRIEGWSYRFACPKRVKD